jgi:hypothetical protein
MTVEQIAANQPAPGDLVIRKILIEGETKWLICEWEGRFSAEPLDLDIAKQRTLATANGRPVWVEECRGGAFHRVDRAAAGR